MKIVDVLGMERIVELRNKKFPTGRHLTKSEQISLEAIALGEVINKLYSQGMSHDEVFKKLGAELESDVGKDAYKEL